MWLVLPGIFWFAPHRGFRLGGCTLSLRSLKRFWNSEGLISVAYCALAKKNPLDSNASHSSPIPKNRELKTVRDLLIDLVKARPHICSLSWGIQCFIPGIIHKSYTNNKSFIMLLLVYDNTLTFLDIVFQFCQNLRWATGLSLQVWLKPTVLRCLDPQLRLCGTWRWTTAPWVLLQPHSFPRRMGPLWSSVHSLSDQGCWKMSLSNAWCTTRGLNLPLLFPWTQKVSFYQVNLDMLQIVFNI